MQFVNAIMLWPYQCLTANSPPPPYAIVAHRTAMRPPKLKTSPLSDVAAAESPPLPLSLSSLPPVAAAPSPKLTRADPVIDENVSLLFCPVGCIRSKGSEMELRSRLSRATMSGPKKSRIKTMRRKK